MSAIYRVTHQTRYFYEGSARDLVNEVRLSPGDFPGQSVRSHRVVTDPVTSLHSTRDAFGNRVVTMYFRGALESLMIGADSVIAVSKAAPQESKLAPFSKETFADPAFRDQHFLYLMPTHLCQHAPALRDWICADWTESSDTLSFLQRVTEKVYRFFDYRPGSTSVETTTADLVALRAGVCQDYAHWMLSVLRMMGIPCRYVSGYLFSDQTEQGTAYVGAQAMHAWVDVLVGPDTWMGFDPTNCCRVGHQHIYVAVGRDYRDIAPIRGVFKGKQRSMTLDLKIREQGAVGVQ
ncbi:MAG: transglutaminase family protein [Firmicutes bacterium]|nr:transglutaminase family protein [Bacillota bacterium]